MADWSMLPCDVLGEIALKLDEIIDFIYFSVVCRSWNRACSLVKPQWKPKTTTMPWMLLAENMNENPDCVRKVYNVSNNKCYQLKLPETFGARCWGSRYGWLAMQTYDFQVHLFNPLTRVRITSLPSLLALPHTPYEPLKLQKWHFNKFMLRCVVLKMPHNHHHHHPPPDNGDGSDLLVGVIYGEFDYLALARPGDQAWTHVDRAADDVFCWGDCIYIVRAGGELSYCDIKRFGVGVGGDLNDINNNKDVELVQYAPECIKEPDGFDKFTLLELCGDLLMVVRLKEEIKERDGTIEIDEDDGHDAIDEIDDDDEDDGNDENNEIDELDETDENNEIDECLPYFTIDFQVYRLDNKIKKWVRIKDIGNFAIFVGNNSSMSVRVSQGKNWMKNCIYFTDDKNRYFNIMRGKDMGVYNLRSRGLTKFYEGDDILSRFCPPMFFVPWLN